MASALVKGPLPSPTRSVVPTLTTKSSTDLLPLDMRLGTSKAAQPHAILRRKQVQKLDIPKPKEQLRRKSSTDIEAQKRCGHYEPDPNTTLLYVECQVNGETAVGLVDTGSLYSMFPREAADAYNLVESLARENGLSKQTTCSCGGNVTEGPAVKTLFKLGSVQHELQLHISQDESASVFRIGMDVLRKWQCVLDLTGCIMYVGGVNGEAVPMLSHENLFGDNRLVRSLSSTL